MNRLEMIYQDTSIEIYFKCDLLTHEYYMAYNNKVVARIYPWNYGNIVMCVQTIPFQDLKKFHEVVINHSTKAL